MHIRQVMFFFGGSAQPGVKLKVTVKGANQPLFYRHLQINLCELAPLIKKWRILLVHSFTACMLSVAEWLARLTAV